MKLIIVSALVVLLAVASHGIPSLLRPPCLNMVNCFVDPCQFSRCDAYPGARCVSDYCGGCNAFWHLNDKRIDCSVPAPVQSETKCITVNCFVNPCAVTKCNKHPTATCRANYCGGCNAYFYDAKNNRVQCD